MCEFGTATNDEVKLLALFCACTAQFLSDLFGNHIIGFPTRWLICCSMSEVKKVNVLKNKPWPPENKPKPKETVHLPRKTEKRTDEKRTDEKRTDENVNQTKPKETEQSHRKTKAIDKDVDEKRTEGNVIQEGKVAHVHAALPVIQT